MSGARSSRIGVVRAAIGIVDLAAAPAVAPLELGHAADDVTVIAYRVLGTRQIVQALLTTNGGVRARRVGIALDLLHAASMLLLALLDPPRRRAALIQCAAGSAFAAAELAARRRAG